MVNDEIHHRILRDSQARPEAQRELVDSLGVSVRSTNYCVRTPVEKGLLKVENFRRSRDKLASENTRQAVCTYPADVGLSCSKEAEPA